MIPSGPINRYAYPGAALILLLSSAAVGAEQPAFATPEDAVRALVTSARSNEPGALMAVLGSAAGELRSGDPVADAAERRSFVEAASEATRIERQGEDLAVLSIGAEDWPFPIPMVHTENGWSFDTEAGSDELLNRRIGRNELHAIAVARAYVEAQYEYAAEDRNGDGRREFAQKVVSGGGEHDGLYWPTADGEPPSPIGPLIAAAVADGYEVGENQERQPYYGYLYRVLTSQGADAPAGSKDWIVDGRLTKGFGLLAYPAQYGKSGIMTFLVNESGLVLQQDLGEETEQLAAGITTYLPDRMWQVVTD